MSKRKTYIVSILIAIGGFIIGFCFNNLFSKSHAEEPKTNAILPSDEAFEVTSTGSTSRADYEIVTIYGRKYIIFSSGGDIEVLNY